VFRALDHLVAEDASQKRIVIVIGIWLVFLQNRITVQLNMSQRENGQVPLPRRRVHDRISSERWEQIKTGYAAGIGLREIAL